MHILNKIFSKKSRHETGCSEKDSEVQPHIVSYSQHAEDLLIKPYLTSINHGIYVDIGAFDPIKYSNTKLLFDQGWTGINIDPNPETKKLFDLYRPNDINLCVGISDVESTLKYHMFDESALNTFSVHSVEDAYARYNVKPTRSIEIEVVTLDSVLDKISLKYFDYLNIDAEGMDFKVLKSINLAKYKPKIVTVETGFSDVIEVLNGDTASYMASYSYRLVAKSLLTSVFLLQYD